MRNHVKIAFWVAMDRLSATGAILPLASGLPYAPLRPGQIGIVERIRWATIREFIHRNYRHFNAGALMEAADAYEEHLRHGGQMLVTLAGAMSTAELGVSLAEMIREGKVHAISCTGANLEEDLFNLVAHDDYVRVSALSRAERQGRGGAHGAAPLPCHRHLHPRGRGRPAAGEGRCSMNGGAPRTRANAYFPHEFLYRILLDGKLKYQIDEKDSWVLAAAQKGLPIWVPGWEDSTLGNTFASYVYTAEQKSRTRACPYG